MTDPDAPAADWACPTHVRFGAGRVAELPETCRDAGLKKPLLVADPGLRDLPVTAAIRQTLTDNRLASDLFSGFQGNPEDSHVTAGIRQFLDGGHDSIIALGGGSAMDVGKAIAFMAGQTRPIRDFEDREDWWKRANADAIAPVIAIPTTAGTGSELGRSAVIISGDSRVKTIVFHPKMLPVAVIIDPELTLNLPPPITAATGMDALSHSLEAWCSPAYHPISQGIALEGIRLVTAWLPEAVRNGGLTARSHMMAAAAMGAIAFQKGLGAMHAMSHPCSSLRGTHHGLTNAVVMPYVLTRNRPAIDEKITALARYLNLKNASFIGFLDHIMRLRSDIAIPDTLADLGVGAELIPDLAPMASVDPAGAGNPVPLNTDDYARLYQNAIDGRLPLSP